MIIHNPFLLTVPNTTYSLLFCSLYFSVNCMRTNTMPVVSLLALNPYWVSSKWSSTMVGTNLFRSTRARIFPTTESWVIPDSWTNLSLLPCFCIRWRWLHRRDHLKVWPNPNHRQLVEHTAWCWSSSFPEIWWNPVDFRCFATPQLLYGFGNFFHRGQFIQFYFEWLLTDPENFSVLDDTVSAKKGLEVLINDSEWRPFL